MQPSGMPSSKTTIATETANFIFPDYTPVYGVWAIIFSA